MEANDLFNIGFNEIYCLEIPVAFSSDTDDERPSPGAYDLLSRPPYPHPSPPVLLGRFSLIS